MSSTDQKRIVEEERRVANIFEEIVLSGRRPESLFKDVIRDRMHLQKRNDELQSLNAVLEANIESFKLVSGNAKHMESLLIRIKKIALESQPPWSKVIQVLKPTIFSRDLDERPR